MCDNRPARAKALSRIKAFALAGRRNFTPPTQGYALGYVLAGLSGRFVICNFVPPKFRKLKAPEIGKVK
jgi:hypothetical protein